MLKAVIFDLDGLLVDSEPVWFDVRIEMFGRFGLRWTDTDQKALMGRSTLAWIDYVDQKLEGRLTRAEIEQQTLDSMVHSYRIGKVRVMPGAKEALNLSKSKAILGLASGSPRVLINAAMEANGWRNHFKEILTSDEVGHGKPAPDVYQEIMKRLHVAPGECVVVEDSASGILAGKAAGAFVIAVPNKELMPPTEALQKADAVIESLVSIEEGIRMAELRQK